MSASLSSRRLATPVTEVDRRLWEWADWARDHGENVGWPGTSVAWRLAKIHETGQSMGGLAPGIEIPNDVAEVDAAVSRLPKELRDVVFIQYFSHDPFEAKARKSKLGRSAYSRALDNARWAVKTVLGC